MDLASLVSAESGAVSLVEFTWPWPPAEDPDEASSCIAYVVMKRDEGFLLCIPPAFIPEQVLAEGQANEASDGVGPSLEVVAPAVRLTPQGEWRVTEGGELVGALVVDLPAAAAASLTVPDVSAFSGAPFMVEEPGLFPLRVGGERLWRRPLWIPHGSRGRPRPPKAAGPAAQETQRGNVGTGPCRQAWRAATPWLRAPPPSIPLQVLQAQVHRSGPSMCRRLCRR